jgi:archaellin
MKKILASIILAGMIITSAAIAQVKIRIMPSSFLQKKSMPTSGQKPPKKPEWVTSCS